MFKDINNNEFFTNHVIGFLRNVNSKDKVLVQEDDGSGRTDEEDIIFTGKVSDFFLFGMKWKVKNDGIRFLVWC